MDRRCTSEEAQRVFAAATERQQRAARDGGRELTLAVAYATSSVTDRKEAERFEQMFDAFRDTIEDAEPARSDVAPRRPEQQERGRDAGIVQDIDAPVDSDTETTNEELLLVQLLAGSSIGCRA